MLFTVDACWSDVLEMQIMGPIETWVLKPEIREWAATSGVVIGSYNDMGMLVRFHFKSAQEAMLFKLTWG